MTVEVGSDDVLWDLEQLKETRGLTNWMFEQFSRYVHGRVLEVGAGIGTFSELLLTKPVTELVLMEPHEPCVTMLERQFSRRGDVQVVPEALPDSPSLARQSGSFDFILCQNVLEHVEDDAAGLQAMVRALKPGGRLGLLVPAHPRLFNDLDTGYGHYRRYTRSLVRERIAEAGLDLEDLYSFNALGIPGWWVQGRKGSAAELSKSSLKAYELLLRAWKPFERHWRPPWGLSVIAVAQKPASGA
jgi:SAM-dependent methyltransferase